MTDEEMAYEYAKYDDNGRVSVNDDKFKAYLAGLKAGRPQWHKVADELPTSDKDKYYFVVDKLNEPMIARFYEGIWSNYSVIEDVISWCEIPTFDKE